MRPPYFNITAVCRNERCRNYGQEFSRAKRKSTYTSTDEREHPIENLVCPDCTAWGKVVRIEEVTA